MKRHSSVVYLKMATFNAVLIYCYVLGYGFQSVMLVSDVSDTYVVPFSRNLRKMNC